MEVYSTSKKLMYPTFSKKHTKVSEEMWPGIRVPAGDLMIVLRMFIHAFGLRPFHDHPDLSSNTFCHVLDLAPWQSAIALQIVVDTTAACREQDERVMILKRQLRDLLGSCEHQTLVRIRNIPFVIEPPEYPGKL